MQVRNLIAWAGLDFAHSPGAVIDLPDDIAAARIAAGLVEAIPAPAEPAPAPDKKRR